MLILYPFRKKRPGWNLPLAIDPDLISPGLSLLRSLFFSTEGFFVRGAGHKSWIKKQYSAGECNELIASNHAALNHEISTQCEAWTR
jgi:hypothetical protein